MTTAVPKTLDIIGLPVAATHYQQAIDWIESAALTGDRAYAVEAANTHVAALARHDAGFGEVMAQFDLICPDGMPLVWMLNHQLVEAERLTDRVYGPTLMLKTIAASEHRQKLKHFFFGGTQATLDKLTECFRRIFPRPISSVPIRLPLAIGPRMNLIVFVVKSKRPEPIWFGWAWDAPSRRDGLPSTRIACRQQSISESGRLLPFMRAKSSKHLHGFKSVGLNGSTDFAVNRADFSDAILPTTLCLSGMPYETK